MLKHFIKYQSLGNDFILYDWYKKPLVFVQNTLDDAGWTQFVTEVCNRHFGVGADGVLIVKSTTESSFPEMLIFNADGSQAEMCLNGLRCVTHYLFTHHGLQPIFKVKIGQRDVDCSVVVDKTKGNSIEIVTSIADVLYQEKATIETTIGKFDGHVVSVGNPHFVVLQQCEQSWLTDHGKELEQHAHFPNRTNVDFIWEDDEYQLHDNIVKAFRLLVYERGCGITLACSSGVAAALWTLFNLGIVKTDEQIAFNMLGGTVIGLVDANNNIVLRASAVMICSGDLEHKD